MTELERLWAAIDEIQHVVEALSRHVGLDCVACGHVHVGHCTDECGCPKPLLRSPRAERAIHARKPRVIDP